MPYTVACAGNPFSSRIAQFIMSNFPHSANIAEKDLVDLLSDVILGTKQTRYGPKPAVESQVMIRDVIRKYVDPFKPIPFMVPWGSQKPDRSSVDVAEVMALKSLQGLNEAIKRYYLPGATFNIRIEDASAPYLYHHEPEAARAGTYRYTQDMLDLTKTLELPFIRIVPESRLVDEEDFAKAADEILPDMHRALNMLFEGHNDDAQKVLFRLGWQGMIAYETRNHYIQTYKKLYPDRTLNDHIYTLARYFSGALARRRLKIHGDLPEWEGSFIDLSFAQPVPGTDGYFNRRVNYRTVPLAMSTNHIPPWRAKGYLKIGEDNDVCAKLASFNDLPDDLQHKAIEFDGIVGKLLVRADYVQA